MKNFVLACFVTVCLALALGYVIDYSTASSYWFLVAPAVVTALAFGIVGCLPVGPKTASLLGWLFFVLVVGYAAVLKLVGPGPQV